jgi:hypothetical protein
MGRRCRGSGCRSFRAMDTGRSAACERIQSVRTDRGGRADCQSRGHRGDRTRITRRSCRVARLGASWVHQCRAARSLAICYPLAPLRACGARCVSARCASSPIRARRHASGKVRAGFEGVPRSTCHRGHRRSRAQLAAGQPCGPPYVRSAQGASIEADWGSKAGRPRVWCRRRAGRPPAEPGPMGHSDRIPTG